MQIKLSRKVLYHFAIFTIIDEKLIIKDYQMNIIFIQSTAKCKQAARYDCLVARRVVFYKRAMHNGNARKK